VDAAIVLDRGMAMTAQAFQSAQAALEAFVNSFHLPSDHVAVVSFTTSGSLNQALTTNGVLAQSAIAGVVPGGTSYIGSGIAAAQAELSGPHHTAGAAQVMIVLSDGADLGAPNPNASVAAAQAAQAAGIRIVSLQYGATPNALMQAIASPGDYHLVGQ
jgi:Mg-chelatase subunit ChlD